MAHKDEIVKHGVIRSYIDPAVPISTIPLRPEEKLLSAYLVDVHRPHHRLSPVETLLLLAGVDREEDVGKKGPVIAARVLPENEKISELRLFEVLFARDALIVADFTFDRFPELTHATTKRLAELQGVSYNNASEEEPGRIVHEVRNPADPIAQSLTRERGWGWPYYGTIDATPLFIRAICRYAREIDPRILQETYTDRGGTVRTIHEALGAALLWLISKTKENPEGLVESRRRNKVGGNSNQAWKDSADAYHHHDGQLANIQSGIASIEVQALAYDAFCEAIDLDQKYPQKNVVAGAVKAPAVATLERCAKQLQAVIMERFWITDERGSYFALGSDRDTTEQLRPFIVRTSNMGHLLNSRLLDGDDPTIQQCREAVIHTLLGPELLNVSGIRTLATHENRFRANSYHNGSVWLWDTYAISLGLLRQGYQPQAQDLWQRIKNVVQYTACFPEFVSGADTTKPSIPNRIIRAHDTKYHFEHLIEQPPQQIQAWSVAAVVGLEYLQKKYAN